MCRPDSEAELPPPVCVRTLTGQRRKLKCRSTHDPCCVDLNTMVFVNRLLFHIFGRETETVFGGVLSHCRPKSGTQRAQKNVGLWQNFLVYSPSCHQTPPKKTYVSGGIRTRAPQRDWSLNPNLTLGTNHHGLHWIYSLAISLGQFYYHMRIV